MDRADLPRLTQRRLKEILDRDPQNLSQGDLAFLHSRRGYLSSDQKKVYKPYFAWQKKQMDAKLAREAEEAKNNPTISEPTVAELMAKEAEEENKAKKKKNKKK